MAGELAHGGWREHDREIICHDTGVSFDGVDSSGVSLQPLSRVHSSFVGLDPGDLKTMGPPKRLECPCESWRPLRIVDTVICGIVVEERLVG